MQPGTNNYAEPLSAYNSFAPQPILGPARLIEIIRPTVGEVVPLRAEDLPARPASASASSRGGVYPPNGPPPPFGFNGGAFPPGAFPPGAFPPGAFPPGAFPPGAFPPGAFPPGAFPPGAYPLGGAPFPPNGPFVKPRDGSVPAPGSQGSIVLDGSFGPDSGFFGPSTGSFGPVGGSFGPARLVEIIRPASGEPVPLRDGPQQQQQQQQRGDAPPYRTEPLSQFTHGYPSGPGRLVHIFRQGKAEPVEQRVVAVKQEVIEPVVPVVQPIVVPAVAPIAVPEPPAPAPKVVQQPIPFQVGGGPFHTNMMSIESLLPAGYRQVQVQWYRADTPNEYYPIPGATEPFYWPTADDLHGTVRADFIVDNGPLRQIEADPDCLTIDPIIARQVEQNVLAKKAVFKLQQRKYNGQLEERTVTFSATDCVVEKAGVMKVRCAYHPHFYLNLSPWEANVFDLEMNDISRNRPVFVCADIRQRDVIALTARSLINSFNKAAGGTALHRVQGLTDIRSNDRMDYRNYEQAMLSV